MDIIDFLKYEKLLAQTLVDEAAVMFTNLIKDVLIGEIKPSIIEMDECLELVGSEYQQDSYHDLTLQSLIKPEERQVVNNKLCRSVTYAYVPIKRVTEKYLANDSIRRKVLEEKKNIRPLQNKPTSGLSNEIKSAANANIADRLHGKLKFELYCDDCETSKSSGLGANHKLLNVYLTCSDLSIADRTHTTSIEKIISVDRNELKTLATDTFDPVYELFEHLRHDLHDLMTTGVLISSEDDSIQEIIQVTISHLCGDNLAIYELLGLSQSFNNNSFFCRFCGFSGVERDGEQTIQDHNLRPPLILDDSQPEAISLTQKARRRFVLDTLPGLTRR